MHVDELTEERIARSDARFRDANEQIRAAARDLSFASSVPFICECSDRSCHAAYEEIRSNPRYFFNVPGHEEADQGTGVTVAERDGYVIVEKQGRAGQVAAELDTRKGERGVGSPRS
jgi:hypothetical protein